MLSWVSRMQGGPSLDSNTDAAPHNTRHWCYRHLLRHLPWRKCACDANRRGKQMRCAWARALGDFSSRKYAGGIITDARRRKDWGSLQKLLEWKKTIFFLKKHFSGPFSIFFWGEINWKFCQVVWVVQPSLCHLPFWNGTCKIANNQVHYVLA